jgi:hypothetical protein
MKFYGKPYMAVTERNKDPRTRQFRRNVLVFRFDQKGEFETEDEKLIKRLMPKFKHESVKETATGDSIKCKKCSFTCSNKGELMAHYRKEHKKDGD